MASVKLTKTHREEILKRAIQHAFKDEVLALMSKFAKLANDVYEDVFSAADRKKMEALPEGWLPGDSEIRVTFGSEHTWLKFNGRNGYMLEVECVWPTEQHRRFPTSKRSKVCKVYDARDAMSVRYEELINARKDLSNRVSEARSNAMAALNRATTLQRLLEGWPEIEPFTRFIPRDRPSLPAIKTDVLNTLLDLPITEEKETA